MFASFDDRIQEIRAVEETLTPIVEEFQKGNFPIMEMMDILIPLMNVDADHGYSDKQKKVQRWIKENPQWVKRFIANPSIPPVVKVPVVLTSSFVAYGTGGRGIAMTTPEIQRYDESAYASGVGGFSMI
tara:strand:+ start:1004 stop:1390 length:387 start_codon:yes stop_codon:yes gene_type:complete